jgi:hypothetical protein
MKTWNAKQLKAFLASTEGQRLGHATIAITLDTYSHATRRCRRRRRCHVASGASPNLHGDRLLQRDRHTGQRAGFLCTKPTAAVEHDKGAKQQQPTGSVMVVMIDDSAEPDSG